MPICGQMDIKGKDTAERGSVNWRNKPRRAFTPAQRLAMVRECEAPGVSVAEVAQRNQVNANLLFKWRRLHLRGQLPIVEATTTALIPVKVEKPKRRAGKRVRPQRTKAQAPVAGAIELELPGARIILHGAVSETNLAAVLRALGRR